jgi:hypothetical protein
MTPGFQVFADPAGNLWVADGWVAQLRSGVLLPAGSGADLSAVVPAGYDHFRAACAATGGTFVGGSGRNVFLSGGPAALNGIWLPGRPGEWQRGDIVLTVAEGTAGIHDATDTIAEYVMTPSAATPWGYFEYGWSYSSTSYGATTYNGGVAFALDLAAEAATEGAIPSCQLGISVGTALGGVYTAVDSSSYVSADDADWTIEVAADGSAELLCAAVVVAIRSAGSATDGAGVFEATTAGETAYNSGEPWRAFGQVIPRAPRAGYAYLELTETDGVLTSAAGPFFSTSLPADTSTVIHAPIVQSDGSGGLVQIVAGTLLFDVPSNVSETTIYTASVIDKTSRNLFLLGL